MPCLFRVFYVQADKRVDPGCIGLNAIQRRGTRVSAGDPVKMQQFIPPASGFEIVVLGLEIGFVKRRDDKQEQVDAKVMASQLTRLFQKQ
eukprot:scaffold43462_cov47-Prasinocladus_malaysianus.AAC.2